MVILNLSEIDPLESKTKIENNFLPPITSGFEGQNVTLVYMDAVDTLYVMSFKNTMIGIFSCYDEVDGHST